MDKSLGLKPLLSDDEPMGHCSRKVLHVQGGAGRSKHGLFWALRAQTTNFDLKQHIAKTQEQAPGGNESNFHTGEVFATLLDVCKQI